MALDEAEVKGETKPISNDGTTKNTPQANDEEARLREVLSKKKIIQKKSRRQNSGADGDAGGGGQDVNDNKNASPAKKKEGQDSEGNAGSQRKSAAPAGAAGETNEKSGGNPVGDGKAANNNRRVRRRRRRNRGARGVSRNAGMGGGRGGGPPMPDSRSFYGGGPDYRGPPGPGYYGGDRGGGWDRRGPPPRRGGGYWDERGRGDHAGRGWRDNRDPHGPPSRGRGRSPVGGGNERGRSPSRSYSRGSSRSSRSFSSSSRSRSSGSRSYSSRSRSRSYSHSSGSRSRSRSYSRSPSRSRSVSPLDKNRKRDRSHSNDGDVSRERRRSKSPTAKSSGNKSRSRSTSPRAVRDGSSERKRQRSEEKEPDEAENALTKDQRTVFVSQLVMRADDRDIRRYFKRKVGAKVRDVILLRDKRTGRHKGCAYVELGSLRDVERALDASGKNPDFQRFPILIKRTEAEKNYTDGLGLGVTTGDPGMAGAIGGTMDTAALAVQLTADGRRIESQKVYVGNVDRCVTQAQLYVLFSQFGPLEKVLLQMDPTTGISRGFAFLSYHDPKDANLAIQTMSGQLLAGRPLKTGWANQQSSIAGVEEVRADLFPSDSNEKVQKVNVALTQLTGSGLVTMLPQVDPSQQQALLAAGSAGALGILPAAQVASVAEAALDMALGASVPVNLPPTQVPAVPPVLDAKIVGRSENPSQHILVHNMFDKDEETDEGWETEIKLDFEEECAQYGKIVDVKVMSKEPGGKIYASFDAIDGATNCAKSLAGRWFDKRQLKVEFVDSIPS